MRTSTGGWRCAVAWVVVAGCASGGSGGATRGANDPRPVAVRGATDGSSRTRLDDSVQVGYGMQQRRQMTGSVASVSGDDARTQHMMRTEELLMRVPGVMVTPHSDGSYSVVIRGVSTLSPFARTDPLFVIDGMAVNDGVGVLNSIPPQDVERIDVIKDAEASIYGSRAANGVILVRTRHARPAHD